MESHGGGASSPIPCLEEDPALDLGGVGKAPISSPGTWGPPLLLPSCLGRRRKQRERGDWRMLKGTWGRERPVLFGTKTLLHSPPWLGGSWLMASGCASSQIEEKIARFKLRRKQKPNQIKPNLLGFLSRIFLPSFFLHPPNLGIVPKPVPGPSSDSLLSSSLLISAVSYLYIVLLMCNSCGADGPGVTRSQSL